MSDEVLKQDRLAESGQTAKRGVGAFTSGRCPGLLFLIVLALSGLAQHSHDKALADSIIPVILNRATLDRINVHSGDQIWLEVAYLTTPHEAPFFVEPAEKIIWIGERPVLFLGASGDPLPDSLFNLNTALVSLVYLGKPVGKTPIQINPRANSLQLGADRTRIIDALQALFPDVGSDLAPIAAFLARAPTGLAGTSYAINGYGPVVNDSGAWIGEPVTESQSLFESVTADTGGVTANNPTDGLEVNGAGVVSTTIAGDTLTISGTEADGDQSNELQNLFTTVVGNTGSTTANSLTDTLHIVGSGTVVTTISGDTLTITGSGGGGNTLDAAYDQGGAGAGRTITADSGAVQVQGIGGLEIDSGSLLQIPGNPSVAGSLSFAGGQPVSVFVSGCHAYVLDGMADVLNVIDVSNPSAPSLVGSLGLGADPGFIHVAGRYAYVTEAGSRELKIIDVSNPSAPSLASSLSVFGVPLSVSVSGRYAYVLYNDFLRVIDVSDPTGPSVTGNFFHSGGPLSLFVSGRYAYLPDTVADVLDIVDVSDPNNPSLVGSVGIGQYPRAVYVSGRYAYVVDGNSQDLRVIDVSDPSAPSQAGILSLGGQPLSIFVSGRYAYVVDTGSDDLKVIDVTDPSTPILAASLGSFLDPNSVHVSGRYAYVVDSVRSDLKVIDVSGAEVTSLIAHALEAGNLQVRNDVMAQGQVQVFGGVNVGLGGLFSDGNIGISGSVALANDVGPTSSPANLVQLYAEDVSGSSELKVRDEAGNMTTLSPHNFSLIGGPSEPMAWSFYSERNGLAINVDILRVMRLIEAVSGETLVHIMPEQSPGEGQRTEVQSHHQRIGALEVSGQALDQMSRNLEQEILQIKTRMGLRDE